MTRLTVADGTCYAVSEHGRGSSLVLLHGFTGSRASWAALVPELALDHRVLTIDLLGHGDSDSPAAARHDVERQALDLAELLARLRATPADVLGYSFGARVALRLAIDAPGSVRRLILESPSAGIADPAVRASRRIADQRWVGQLARGDMTGFVRDWAAQPIFASQARLPAATRLGLDAERRGNRPEGLAASLLGAGQGVMAPLHGRLGTITAPTLVISGRLDPRGSERAEEVAQGIPSARHESIEDAGHTPHLETPEQFLALVLSALATPIVAPIPTPATERTIMPVTWTTVRPREDVHYEDIRYEHSGTGIARVTIDRQHVRNAFRPQTVTEMLEAFRHIRDDASIGVAILTGAGDIAFCSGGDQSVKIRGGYQDADGVARLNVLDLQRLIRSLPIPVIALVNGYAIGGGHVLHVICDLSIASENAIFGQTGPRVGSFDAGYGATMLARIVGHKKAREIWYLCRQYSAAEALEMGLVNAVVPLAELEAEGIRWCDEILEKSPTAIRFLKRAFNADVDGLAGLQELAGDATMLYYTTDEAHEGSQAFLEKRKPDFSRFPRRP